MESRREQVFVGLFVIVAAAVLVGMVFAISGAFGGAGPNYRRGHRSIDFGTEERF